MFTESQTTVPAPETAPESKEPRRGTSHLNALKHGFTAQFLLLSIEESVAYRAHFKSFEDEYKPKTPNEVFLLTSMAEMSWSCQQMRIYIANLMTQRGQTHEPAQDFGHELINSDVAKASFLIEHAKEVNLIGLYEQRKMRTYRETAKELERVQTNRRQQERADMAAAAAFRKVFLAKYKPGTPTWEPSAEGFVFSLAEIDQYIGREERKNDVLQFIQAANKAK